MKLEEFEHFLSVHGIKYKMSGQSIVFEDCPECGDKYKVHFFRERENENAPFFGKCFSGKCQTGYSSIKYLIRVGVSRNEVLNLHQMSAEMAFQKITSPDDIMSDIGNVQKSEKKKISVITSHFFSIPEWKNHPVVLYAKGRGLVERFYDRVMIDHFSNSVVFLVKENDKPIGYQIRYLNPANPRKKTETSSGFSRDNLLVFENDGPVCVCEGPFTALSAWHFGFHAVCTFGSSVTQTQVKKIEEIAGDRQVYVAFDQDKAGSTGKKIIASYFYWKKIPVFEIVPEIGNDLNDSWQAGKRFIDKGQICVTPAIPNLVEFS